MIDWIFQTIFLTFKRLNQEHLITLKTKLETFNNIRDWSGKKNFHDPKNNFTFWGKI